MFSSLMPQHLEFFDLLGAIVGVGAAQDVKAVRWGITLNLVAECIPAAALIAALFWRMGRNFM